MPWRVLLTALYAVACGAAYALDNQNLGPPAAVLFPVLLGLGALVGFLVGRWWVLLAVLGGLVGRTIGWDDGGNDGNPALWWPYVFVTVVFFGGALLFGLLLSLMFAPGPASDSRSARRTDA